jgi:hypothetical protein
LAGPEFRGFLTMGPALGDPEAPATPSSQLSGPENSSQGNVESLQLQQDPREQLSGLSLFASKVRSIWSWLKTSSHMSWARLITASFIILALLGLWWIARPREPEAISVAEQWTQTINNYGIEPVYPPQEDVLVGDIYAMITSDAEDRKGVSKTPPLLKAIKLSHEDLSGELEETYDSGFQFPATAERPKDTVSIWPEANSMGSIFTKSGTLHVLPLALLPDFLIVAKRNFGIQGGTIDRIANALNLNGSNNQSVTMRLSGVETYGVSAIAAEKALYKFCQDPNYISVCTDRGIRTQLSIIVGDKIYDKTKACKNEKDFRYGVNIALVSRAYLIRGLETEIDQSTQLSVQGAPGPAGQPSTNGTPPPSAQFGFEKNTGVSVKPQTFERPIVIGIRTVRLRTGDSKECSR